MGLCVSAKRSSDSEASAMKMGISFGSKPEKLAIPPSPVKNRPIQSPSGPKDFGSKEDAFFDSQAWLDSDCEDDFYSVNGDFTPSRGSTPVHGFSRGSTPVHKALGDKTPNNPIPEPSPTGTKKKLLELFDEDQDVNEQQASSTQHIANEKPEARSSIQNLFSKPSNGTPFVSGADSVAGSEQTANGDDPLVKEKSIKASPCCIPSLLSCRSLTDRKKKVNHAITV